MPIKRGDFVLISYVARVKEDGRVISTNMEEEAKKAGIYEEGRLYEPELVIVGEGWVLKGLDEELEKFEVGEEREVELPPERAFGKRDPSKIRVISARELSRRGIVPRVNMEVEVDGRRAIVRSVGGGRVVLDFNHPLAGKTIVYRVKIIKKLEGLDEKILELAHRWLPRLSKSKISVSVAEDGTAVIELPEEVLGYERLGLIQRGITRDIERYLSNISAVRYVVTVKLRRQRASEQRQA